MDNHEMRIKFYPIRLIRDDLENIPHYELPSGYSFRFYQGESDIDVWIDIEKSAKEFISYSEGVRNFETYFGKYKELLYNRMIFVVAPNGKSVATASAYFEPWDDESIGWLHWVAVRREYQGKGLSRPLISKTLETLKSLGYKKAKVPTQTTSWVAAKLYLDFGYRPEPQNVTESEYGYRILNTLTSHPSLASFEKVGLDDVFDKEICDVADAVEAFVKNCGEMKVLPKYKLVLVESEGEVLEFTYVYENGKTEFTEKKI